MHRCIHTYYVYDLFYSLDLTIQPNESSGAGRPEAPKAPQVLEVVRDPGLEIFIVPTTPVTTKTIMLRGSWLVGLYRNYKEPTTRVVLGQLDAAQSLKFH